MTRRVDGSWELSSRELKLLVLVWPLLTAAFSAGAAWTAVRSAIDGKVDRSDYALTVQRLQVADSLQLVLSKELTDRVREMACGKRPACR